MTVAQPIPASSSIPHAALNHPFQGATLLIALIILTMGIRQVALGEIGRAHIRIGDVLILVCFVLWLAAGCVRGRWFFPTNVFDQVVVIFVVLYVLSILWGSNIDQGLYQGLKIMRNGMLYILLVAYLSANFPSRYLFISKCFLVTGFFQALGYIWSMEEHGGIVALTALLQNSVIRSNNAVLDVVRVDMGGGLLLRGIGTWFPLCMIIGFSIIPFVPRWQRVSIRILILWWFVLTVLSTTRAAWVALTIAFITIGLLGIRQVRLNQLLFSIISVTSVLAGGLYFDLHHLLAARLPTDVFVNDPSMLARYDYFQIAWDSFKASPIFGKGVGNIDGKHLLPQGGLFIVHNVYLQVLGELGIIGSLIFVVLIMVWLWSLFVARKRAVILEDSFIARVSVMMLGASMFFFAYFFVGHDLAGGEPWIVMGIASAIYTHGRRRDTFRSEVSPSPI